MRKLIAALMLVSSHALAADIMPDQAKLDFMRGEIGLTAAYAAGVANTVYTVGTRIQNAGNIYELTAAMSGNSTTAPTGTTTATDNGGTWTYREPACVYKMALHASTASANMTASATKQASIGNEVTGTNYTAGGATVSFSAVGVSANHAQLTMNTITWSTATITARYGVLYCATKGGVTIDRIVGLYDFASDKTSTAGDFSLTSSAGVVQITRADGFWSPEGPLLAANEPMSYRRLALVR